MSKRFCAVSSALAVMIGGVSLAKGLAAGQTATVAAKASSRAAGSWTTPRTGWGDPDLQGIWDSKTQTPLERPAKFAGREFLTDEEVAALEKATIESPGRDARAERGTVADVEGAYNNAFSSFFGTKVVRTKRTSLVVDPPNGKLPALTPEGQKRVAAFKRVDTVEGGRAGRADNPEDRPNDRCPSITLPCTSPLCAFTRIVQTPGSVAIYYESGHWGGAYRTIPLNGRPHLPSDIRQRLGDSRGRWEGDTLVVDTTNFTNQTNVEGSGENLHLVERFTRAEPDVILYRATVEDSTAFTKPWTIELPWVRRDDKGGTPIYDESACHEGNYAMTSILAGARAQEKEKSDSAAKKQLSK